MPTPLPKYKPEGFHGLLVAPPKPKDFVLGVNSPLTMADIQPSGTWEEFTSTLEKQNQYGLETFNCTSFGYTNAIEDQINRMIIRKTIKAEFLKFLTKEGYLDSDGRVNFSERALGHMSGTTSGGNYLNVVAETARTKGLAPNSLWAWNGENTIEAYYAKPPQKVFDVALKFLDYVDLPYHWGTDIYDAIKRCPVYSGLVTCSPWLSSPVPWCNANGANHALVTIKAVEGQNLKVQDSYEPANKELGKGYHVPYIIEAYAVQKQAVLPNLTGYKTADNPTVFIKMETGVFVPVASWDAFVKLGGSSGSIKVVPESEITPVVRDVFLEK